MMNWTRREFAQLAAAAPLAGAEWRPRADYDAGLGDWGPYGTRYIGISHVADRRRGLRFDLSVFPGYYRRKISVPNVRWESDFTPWECSGDAEFYSFRHQLEWKDRVYCDVSYSPISEHARLIRCECVNATPRAQNLVLHLMGYLVWPRGQHEVALPAGAVWVDALDYLDLRFATPRPTDNLTYDGLLRAEAFDEGFTGGSGIGKSWGKEAGDRVEYRVELPAPVAELWLRYRAAKGAVARVTVAGKPVALEGTGGFATVRLPLPLPAGRHDFRVVSLGAAAVDLDGFAFAPARAEVAWKPERQEVAPETLETGERRLLLKYPALDHWYGVAWSHPRSQVRQFVCGELDRFFRDRLPDHTSLILRGPGEGHYTNAFLRPIPMTQNSTTVVYAMVCDGAHAEVERLTAGFRPDEEIYRAARAKAVRVTGRAAGRSYEFSQDRMAACTLSNILYPLYIRRHYITLTFPGRWWPMLYSWDAGFTGLGLLECDTARSAALLNAYLTPPGDQHAAFIHHGTPLPIQVYQFLDLWNRTRSRALLEYFYPRLRQYHLFLAGRLGSSTTRRLKSQLLQTWDYFYNTGWDDYPPQQYMHAHKLRQFMAAPTTTAHAIRCARILTNMAEALGERPDYAEDIAVWSDALQRYSWDEESGYYGYVEHDAGGRPKGILRHQSGMNFNMGMCGAYPFFADICTPAQEKRILGHMMSERRLWTHIGMTSVDQSAPYYLPDGYWNGAVWFPHQWLVWRSLLDLGYGDEAWRIARTALDLWRDEVDDSYNCHEHFMVDSGRGAGWHQFTSLSTPVLSWFASYYRPGILTTGYDTWLERSQFSPDNRRLEATLRMTGPQGREAVVLCGMAEGSRYQASLDGRPAKARMLETGALEVRVPHGGTRKLLVSAL